MEALLTTRGFLIMATPEFDTTLIDLSPQVESPRVLRGTGIVEMHDPNTELSTYGDEIVQGHQPAESDTDVLTPETKPLEDYESPLTLGLIQERYRRLITPPTEDAFFEVIPDTEEYEAVRQTAKEEITKAMLWKMGIANDYKNFLDIDVVETRDLLDEEFFSIPEEVDRDNNPNSFRRRKDLLEAHILETSQDPDIHERLKDMRDIWIGDLMLRAEIMQEGTQGQLELKRQEYVDELMKQDTPSQDTLLKIGNTLLHATPEQLQAFHAHVRAIAPDTLSSAESTSTLLAYIEKYYPITPDTDSY